MKKINNFNLLHDFEEYEKTTNPKGLSVFDSLPHGVSWLFDENKYEIKYDDKIVALLLQDNQGIALIESPFNQKNQAYIISPPNEIKFNVGEIARKAFGNIVFTDAYFISNEIFFFVNRDGHDYRFSFEPKNGEIGRLIQSR